MELNYLTSKKIRGDIILVSTKTFLYRLNVEYSIPAIRSNTSLSFKFVVREE